MQDELDALRSKSSPETLLEENKELKQTIEELKATLHQERDRHQQEL
jgi:cell division septum initiation protein DivIVA